MRTEYSLINGGVTGMGAYPYLHLPARSTGFRSTKFHAGFVGSVIGGLSLTRSSDGFAI